MGRARAGRVDEALIDDKVLRILRLAARVGGLDGVKGSLPVAPAPVDIPRELRATAAASFVLARNERSSAGPGGRPPQTPPDSAGRPDQAVPLLPFDRAGRLPTTWPASQDGLPSARPANGVLTYTEGLFIGYRAYDRDGRQPLFPFGHGRGYTTWSYESITVDCAPENLAEPPGAPGVAVCVQVRNTGPRPGREIVQVYAPRPDSAVERPAKWLAGFAAVDAGPGAAVNVGILLPERAFQHWADGGWTLEAGTFTLSAGSSSASLPLTASVKL